MGKAVAYGDEWLGNESVGKREDEITALSTGNQAVPITEPDWDYNTDKGRWIGVILSDVSFFFFFLSDVFFNDSGRHVLSL